MEEKYRSYIKVSNKFKLISDKYHNMSLLFYELSKSIKLEGKNKSEKEFKEYLKTLDLDINKIISLSQTFQNLGLDDIQKEVLKDDKI